MPELARRLLPSCWPIGVANSVITLPTPNNRHSFCQPHHYRHSFIVGSGGANVMSVTTG